MFKRKKALDEQTREALVQELKAVTLISEGIKTEFGQALIKLLEDSIDDTEKQWLNKPLFPVNDTERIDDSRLPFFRAAVSSKLQTLKGLRNMLVGADELKRNIEIELASNP